MRSSDCRNPEARGGPDLSDEGIAGQVVAEFGPGLLEVPGLPSPESSNILLGMRQLTGTSSNFSLAFCGGIDANVNSLIAVRLFQADYLQVRI